MGPTPGPTRAQLRSVILIFRVFWLENVLFSINDRLGLEAPDIFGLIFVERVQILDAPRNAEAHAPWLGMASATTSATSTRHRLIEFSTITPSNFGVGATDDVLQWAL